MYIRSGGQVCTFNKQQAGGPSGQVRLYPAKIHRHYIQHLIAQPNLPQNTINIVSVLIILERLLYTKGPYFLMAGVAGGDPVGEASFASFETCPNLGLLLLGAAKSNKISTANSTLFSWHSIYSPQGFLALRGCILSLHFSPESPPASHSIQNCS